MPDVSNGPALVSMAQQFAGLPMRSLIGGPLNAAAQANSMMAVTQTKFMLDTCFNKSSDTKDKTSLTPIMVTMQITRGVISEGDAKDGEKPDVGIDQVTTQFDVPLLTIIPLNSLGVETVQVDFEMEVKSSYSDESSQSSSSSTSEQGSFDAKLGEGWWSVEVKGSISHDSQSASSQKSTYQKSNNAKYTVSVGAGQLPLPQGVTTIIQAFSNSISPITIGSSKKADDS
ncbi:DUF2589 domain-containing protein [Enterovibrio norvegicus]|uniref:DUF2589 domain-containing protein n=1 Tax=Enterovibrio norvegicus TaxID=188144 RepID=UPI000C832ECA|nr:DUF2589 domain-containing protein [Enterovibrio norvegicus]MCC4798370.1 DUF2589 domain-containing protein [Enterovibrio norvegicus]PMH65300.1 hypothetical protein BCU62_13350 [Enterovibrio norvegicus]PMI33191.1 hypothetical protein BCU46_03690 [Enterovibrio norvegicus]PMI33602.1 hypothetical protein BCU47_09160 [Enterovibrio norvegicus]PML78415.1 hypothetical protein BCT69_16415 [Enterovibrio norvegicus]